MVTLQYEATKMFRRKMVVPVCLRSWEQYRRGERSTLDVRVRDEWATIVPRIPEPIAYKHYSHTVSPDAMRQYFPRQYEKLYGGVLHV